MPPDVLPSVVAPVLVAVWQLLVVYERVVGVVKMRLAVKQRLWLRTQLHVGLEAVLWSVVGVLRGAQVEYWVQVMRLHRDVVLVGEVHQSPWEGTLVLHCQRDVTHQFTDI